MVVKMLSEFENWEVVILFFFLMKSAKQKTKSTQIHIFNSTNKKQNLQQVWKEKFMVGEVRLEWLTFLDNGLLKCWALCGYEIQIELGLLWLNLM